MDYNIDCTLVNTKYTRLGLGILFNAGRSQEKYFSTYYKKYENTVT